MVKVYGSPHCGHCMVIKRKLEAKKIEFEYSDDIELLTSISERTSIQSSPIVEVDGVFHNAVDASKLLGI